MKIVLTTSPSEEDQHGVRSLPPLSLGYLAAAVKNLPGATVLIVDAYGEALNVPQATERILALSPDLVGISATSFCFKSGVRLVSRLKAARPDLVTVMGGYHPTQFDELLLKELPDLDLVLRGEGDRSFPELCRRLITSEAIDGVRPACPIAPKARSSGGRRNRLMTWMRSPSLSGIYLTMRRTSINSAVFPYRRFPLWQCGFLPGVPLSLYFLP